MNIQGFIIDSDTQSIKPIELKDDITIADTQKILNAQDIDIIQYGNDVIYYDMYGDESRLTFFRFKSKPIKWYGGKAFVFSFKSDMLLGDCIVSKNELKEDIIWCQLDNEEDRTILKPESHLNVYKFTMKDLYDIFIDNYDI